MEIEQNKRKQFTDSRKNNRNGKNQYTKKEGQVNGHMTSHMVNRNEDIDISLNNSSSNIHTTNKEQQFNFDCIKENTQYMESVFSATVTARKYKLSFPKFQSLTDIFIADQKIKNGIPKNELDYRDHFVNWMRIQTSKPENWDRKMVY